MAAYSGVVGELGGNEEAATAKKRYGIPSRGDNYVVKLIMMVTQLCKYIKSHRSLHFTCQ